MNAIDESLPLPNWTQSAGEEVANGISHGIGLVGAMIGTPILLLAALHHGNIPFLIGYDHLYHDDVARVPGIDALSLLAADPYEISSPSTRSFGDFLLIAGTYTPFALGPLRGGGGLAMLGIVWALALSASS